MKEHEQLEQFLRQTAEVQKNRTGLKPPEFKYYSIEDFVLQQGRIFEATERPSNMQKKEDRQCFMNCFQILLSSKKYEYAEGFAMGLIPTLHAWLVDKDGKAVDPTWAKPGCAYYGVVLPRELVIRSTYDRGRYGVLDNWEQDWPILRKGLPN